MSLASDQDLNAEFVVESLDHLAEIETQLAAVESAGEEIDFDSVNTALRTIHSVKEAAGFLELETIRVLAHGMESVLNLFRSQMVIPTAANIDVLLRSAHVLHHLLDETDTSNDVAISEHLKALSSIVDGAQDDVTKSACSP